MVSTTEKKQESNNNLFAAGGVIAAIGNIASLSTAAGFMGATIGKLHALTTIVDLYHSGGYLFTRHIAAASQVALVSGISVAYFVPTFLVNLAAIGVSFKAYLETKNQEAFIEKWKEKNPNQEFNLSRLSIQELEQYTKILAQKTKWFKAALALMVIATIATALSPILFSAFSSFVTAGVFSSFAIAAESASLSVGIVAGVSAITTAFSLLGVACKAMSTANSKAELKTAKGLLKDLKQNPPTPTPNTRSLDRSNEFALKIEQEQTSNEPSRNL